MERGRKFKYLIVAGILTVNIERINWFCNSISLESYLCYDVTMEICQGIRLRIMFLKEMAL